MSTSMRHYHTTSYEADEKYLPSYYATDHHQRTSMQSIRRGLCRIFGLKSRKHVSPRNNRQDEFAAADTLPYDEAEMLEDENMAWGKPPRKSRTKRESGRRDRNPERPPHAPPPYVKFEAEMLDEDNMAWGKPTSRKTQHRASLRNPPRPGQKRSSVGGPEQARWCC